MFVVKVKCFDKMSPEEQELVYAINDGQQHRVAITTNKLEFERDNRDCNLIKRIKNVKVTFRINEGGCLILKGSLGCSFMQPMGGELFVVRAQIVQGLDFDNVQGVKTDMKIHNFPMTIGEMESHLTALSHDERLVFNMSQFDEFMDIFNFYKQLSAELNNNDSYPIVEKSKPYYFVSSDEKEISVDDNNAMINQNGVIVGYRIDNAQYEYLTEEAQERVRKLIDITISGDEKRLKKVRSFRENLYVSSANKVDEDNVRSLISFDLVNIVLSDNQIVVSGELGKKDDSFQYLNLYDMGQKVKLESINNSLRLIQQGGTGQASLLLEYLIGNKTMPSFGKNEDDITKKYTKYLDDSQKKAFLMAIDGSPVSLIKGPPGTGKTHVINAVVQYITKELNEKVVISSQTHVAIDNVLDKLMENYDLIIPNRITNRRNKYAGEYIDSTLFKTWGRNFFEHNQRAENKKLAEQIKADMLKFEGEKRFSFSEHTNQSDYSIIGATTTTSAIGGMRGLEVLDGYNWLIIDEVSKCPITEVLRYLPYVNQIIMVGDDFQLAPLLEFSKDEVKDLPSYDDDKFDRLRVIYENSVFATTLEKAKAAGRLVTLNVNYRSVNQVLGAYNVFYDNQLQNKREAVKPSKVQLIENGKLGNDKDVFFVDVQNGKETRDLGATSRYNIEELAATAEILEILMKEVINPTTVSVSAIFPYAAQIDKFQKKYLELINTAKKHFKSFEIDTVDAFQGKETDIVLVNTVVTDPSQRNFLNDFRRINVSMSRARDKLFVFGNPTTLSKIEMQVTGGQKRTFFYEIIMDIRRCGKIITYDRGVRNEIANKPKITIG